MKKILTIILLGLLFVSCVSEQDDCIKERLGKNIWVNPPSWLIGTWTNLGISYIDALGDTIHTDSKPNPKDNSPHTFICTPNNIIAYYSSHPPINFREIFKNPTNICKAKINEDKESFFIMIATRTKNDKKEPVYLLNSFNRRSALGRYFNDGTILINFHRYKKKK